MGVAVIVAIAYEDTIRTMQSIFKFSLFHFRSGTLYLEILRLIYFTIFLKIYLIHYSWI